MEIPICQAVEKVGFRGSVGFKKHVVNVIDPGLPR